ncbi:hypothetical protein PAXINDRAFT_15049 [Paxillus involutus ATCC 200175]|uniref:Uncharacterized protein n=1 Tax=Paxillus involutus ATCC 200175 TaxID=664439 RepID=A0A0C9TY00_PAXIN|nr:hypothetical protein PAXINDRAFT_15049 [Paxillus involutus ATCC 200175]
MLRKWSRRMQEGDPIFRGLICCLLRLPTNILSHSRRHRDTARRRSPSTSIELPIVIIACVENLTKNWHLPELSLSSRDRQLKLINIFDESADASAHVSMREQTISPSLSTFISSLPFPLSDPQDLASSRRQFSIKPSLKREGVLREQQEAEADGRHATGGPPHPNSKVPRERDDRRLLGGSTDAVSEEMMTRFLTSWRQIPEDTPSTSGPPAMGQVRTFLIKMRRENSPDRNSSRNSSSDDADGDSAGLRRRKKNAEQARSKGRHSSLRLIFPCKVKTAPVQSANPLAVGGPPRLALCRSPTDCPPEDFSNARNRLSGMPLLVSPAAAASEGTG